MRQIYKVISEMKRKIEQILPTPRQERRESESIYCVSVGSTGDEDDSSPLQLRLKTLEQRHKQLNNFYLSKINELAEIIKQQGSKKQELIQELLHLSKLTQQQKHYVNALKDQLESSPEQQDYHHQQGQTVPAYLMGTPEQGRHEPKPRGGKSRGHLFRSAQFKQALLKHSKSQTDLDNDYYPVTTASEQQRGTKQPLKENQRRYNPLLNN